MDSVAAGFSLHPPDFWQHPQPVLDPQHRLCLSEQASTPASGACTAPWSGVGVHYFLLSLGRPGRWVPSDGDTGLFTSSALALRDSWGS